MHISYIFPSLNLLSIHTLKSGKLQFTAPTAHIKVLTGGESESGQDKKSHRQNVAIQVRNKHQRIVLASTVSWCHLDTHILKNDPSGHPHFIASNFQKCLFQAMRESNAQYYHGI